MLGAAAAVLGAAARPTAALAQPREERQEGAEGQERAEGIHRPERPPVAITLVGCDDAVANEAQRIAAIELRATLAQSAGDGRTTEVIASCERRDDASGQGERANLEAHEPSTGKTFQRTVVLAHAAPSARARLLALAIAELVAAAWSDRDVERADRSKVAAPPVAAVVREGPSPAPTSRAFELTPMVGVQVVSSRDWLYGAGARLAFWLSPVTFLRVDASADYAELGRTLGTVKVVMPSAAAALGTAPWTGGWLRPAVSFGVRAGYAWMTGQGDGADTMGSRQHGFCLGPEIALQLTAWTRAQVRPVVGLVAGAHLIGVRGTVEGPTQNGTAGGGVASNERDVRLTGLWGGLNVGLAVP